MTSMRFWFVACVTLGCGHPTTPSVTIAASVTDAAPPIVAPHEEELPCSAYAHDGVTPNPARARACLEAIVKTQSCDEGSPPLEMLELAVSLIDGTGGPADSKRALALFDHCFEDASVQAVREHATKKAASPSEPPLTSCDAFAATTLALSECLAEHGENEAVWLRVAKRNMPSDRAALFTAAARAHDVYATKMGAIAYARFGNGSMRNPAMRAVTLALMRRRHARIERLMEAGYIPPAPELARAEANAERALQNARSVADAPTLAAIEEADAAWPAYRDAEIAFYESYHPGGRTLLTAALDVERYVDLCDAP